jgi:hypothetical protein
MSCSSPAHILFATLAACSIHLIHAHQPFTLACGPTACCQSTRSQPVDTHHTACTYTVHKQEPCVALKGLASVMQSIASPNIPNQRVQCILGINSTRAADRHLHVPRHPCTTFWLLRYLPPHFPDLCTPIIVAAHATQHHTGHPTHTTQQNRTLRIVCEVAAWCANQRCCSTGALMLTLCHLIEL